MPHARKQKSNTRRTFAGAGPERAGDGRLNLSAIGSGIQIGPGQLLEHRLHAGHRLPVAKVLPAGVFIEYQLGFFNNGGIFRQAGPITFRTTPGNNLSFSINHRLQTAPVRFFPSHKKLDSIPLIAIKDFPQFPSLLIGENPECKMNSETLNFFRGSRRGYANGCA